MLNKYNICSKCKYYDRINICFGNCKKFQIQVKFDSKCLNHELKLAINDERK